MAHPSKFISNSDFASTPASLAGAITLTLSVPANVSLTALTPTTYKSEAVINGDFDSFIAYLQMDGREEIQINFALGVYEVGSPDPYDLWAKVEMTDSHRVVLKAVLSSFSNTSTGNHPHTFTATIIPIKSPFSA